jgi:hypothetical protein
LKTSFIWFFLLLSVGLAQTTDRGDILPRTFEYSTLVLDYETQQFFWVGDFGIIGPYTALIDLGQVITGDSASFEDEALSQILNHAGSHSWEVITVLESGSRFRFILKRSFE